MRLDGLDLSLISNGNQKENAKSMSRFPQTEQKTRQPYFLVSLSLRGVFSNSKGGRRMRGAGLLGCPGTILPSCGNSFIGPKP